LRTHIALTVDPDQRLEDIAEEKLLPVIGGHWSVREVHRIGEDNAQGIEQGVSGDCQETLILAFGRNRGG
jgi:hypothetical protein